MNRPSLATAATWVLAVLMIAGIVHISSVFLLPSVAVRDSYVRLVRGTKGPGFKVLPQPSPGDESLPFTDPGTILAVCRYDVGLGPFRVRIDIDSEALTSLSFRTRNGTVFHTLTDRAAWRGRLDVLLGSAAQVDAAEAADTDEAPVREVRLIASSPVGIVLVRAMASSAASLSALRRRIEAAECEPIR